MGRQTIVEIILEKEGGRFIDIVNSLTRKEWTLEDPFSGGQITLLSHENEYEWLSCNGNIDSLMLEMEENAREGQRVGVMLFHRDDNDPAGIELLGGDNLLIRISLSVNARRLGDDVCGIIDLNWYSSTVIRNIVSEGFFLRKLELIDLG